MEGPYNRYSLVDDRIREIVRFGESVVRDNADRLTSCLVLATEEIVTREVELLWFSECPNHDAARMLLEQLTAEVAPGTPIREVDATDPAVAECSDSRARRRSGLTAAMSILPTLTPGDYTPRSRLYRTTAGLRWLPERSWVEDALRRLRP